MFHQKLSHRVSTQRIRIVSKDGLALSNTPVQIKLKKHKFLFGSGCFDSIPFANSDNTNPKYEKLADRMSKWEDLFNYATLPFYWGGFEPQQGQPRTKELMNAAAYLNSKNITVKGHPLCWHTATAPYLLSMTEDEIYKTQMQRIKREVIDFKGSIDIWDAINEVVIMPNFDKYDNGITRICKKMGRINLIREVFREAREHNPNATLILNDFNTSAAYEILIDGCLEAGIQIDAIGIQSHQHQGYWGADRVYDVLERFSRFNLPIHFTENTLTSGHIMPKEIDDLNDYQLEEWPSTPEFEDRQANEYEEMYRILFEHPLVEAITMWTFCDEGSWLKAPAGILKSDNSPKPAYHRLHQLIKQEWSTFEELVTDENGYITITGFKGEYDIVAQETKVSFHLDCDKDETTIQLV